MADKSNTTKYCFGKSAKEIVYGIGKITYLQSTKGNILYKILFSCRTLCQKLTLKPRLKQDLKEDQPLMQIIKASIFTLDKKQYTSGHKPS